MAAMKKNQKEKQSEKVGHDRKLLVQIYKDLCLYRRFEERVNIAYTTRRKFAGFCHLHIGQEALCVGVQKSIRVTDYMVTGYRSHTQAIAKGISPNAVMAELFGKVDGAVRGKGGSMHMFSKDKRFLGGHGIVGGQVPLAVGAAFAIKYRGEKDVVICYVGDAATNQGAFHEALNMAAIWDLPVLCIIENNRYGMGTDIHRTTSIDHLWKRALAYDMDHSQIDALDTMNVYEHVSGIVADMRERPRPHLLEAMTYRYRGHSVSDPANYRTKEEVAEVQKRDSILQHGEFLKKLSIASDADLVVWDEEARAIAAAAEEFADSSAKPEIDELWTHVFAD